MAPQIQILEAVVRRLQLAEAPKTGNLYGIMYDGKTFITGINFVSDTWGNFSKFSVGSIYDEDRILYPTGVDFCGLFQIGGDCSVEVSNVHPQVLLRLKDVSVTNNPVFLLITSDSGNMAVYYLHRRQLVKSDYELLNYSRFKEKFIFLRLLGNMSIKLPMENIQEYQREIDKLTERIDAGMVFRVSRSDLFIYKYNLFNVLTATIGKVYDYANKSRDLITGFEVLDIYAYFPSSVCLKEGKYFGSPYIVDFSCCREPRDSEFLIYDKADKSYKLNVKLPFDGLSVVYRERPLNDVYSLLIDATEGTILNCKTLLSEYINHPKQLQKMKIYHFFNDVLCHPISLIFLTDDSDEDLLDLRHDIHKLLKIPLDRPFFRRSNCLKLNGSGTTSEALINVHIGIKHLAIKNSKYKTVYVFGNYEYYHYMMGGVNDLGWGCAYRSLQTIFSWFKLQGYTEAPIPSHKEIQETLVTIGDKTPEIVGSKTWIGCAEVCYFLQNKLGVDSRILYVPSGSEIASIADTLMDHFLNQGTPAMIGGGVLAHTIVGLSIEEENKGMQLLVLDPHYTGENNLKAIHSQGYVGWKGASFWDSATFYNLCLPQRPICF